MSVDDEVLISTLEAPETDLVQKKDDFSHGLRRNFPDQESNELEIIGEVLPAEIPKEQIEYQTYIEARQEAYDRIQKLIQERDNSRLGELGGAINEYQTQYGVNPVDDIYMAQTKNTTKEEFLNIVKQTGDETAIRLPILVDKDPVVLTIHKGKIGDTRTQVCLDVGTMKQWTGTVTSFGRSDFQIYEKDGEKIAMGNMVALNVPNEDEFGVIRARLANNPSALVVDTKYLKEHNLKGLGSMLFSLGRYIALQEGVKERVVEQDTSRKDHSDSFYVSTLGARVETRKHPIYENMKDMPVFDTAESPGQPYKFGYWVPVK
jgi:hypothetical protein